MRHGGYISRVERVDLNALGVVARVYSPAESDSFDGLGAANALGSTRFTPGIEPAHRA